MDADIMGLAGMLFVLLMIAMVGGFILLVPISRRLGAYLEQRLEDGRAGASLPSTDVAELRELILSVQSQLEELAERQEFTDRLLADRGTTGAITSGLTDAGTAQTRGR